MNSGYTNFDPRRQATHIRIYVTMPHQRSAKTSPSDDGFKQPAAKRTRRNKNEGTKLPKDDQVAKHKRVSKNAAGKPVAIDPPIDARVVQLDDTAEHRLSMLIYNQPCDYAAAPCFVTMHEEELISIMNTENPEIKESGLVCRRCKSKRIMSRSLQIRGGDEATTVFATCADCKYAWREN